MVRWFDRTHEAQHGYKYTSINYTHFGAASHNFRNAIKGFRLAVQQAAAASLLQARPPVAKRQARPSKVTGMRMGVAA